MNFYRSTFPRKNTFIAVVHVENPEQALRNARIAEYEGADGIFLINHNINYKLLLDCYDYIRDELPNLWIGLNCLDLGRQAVAVIPKDTKGLWVDNVGIIEGARDPVYEARRFNDLCSKMDWHGIYFGGIAFKYQALVKDVARVAKLATQFMDVVTTSGFGTGMAADINKIRIIKEAIGDHPLALASGVTPKNVNEYMPYVDCFLVATGVSDSYTELNPNRVYELAKALRV